ncbi:MAG TPA: sugar phosphate isomerase/epimerase [Candidatus Dormibacteraeota bacterium]|nr:sugar phosphate isomerase/epimerase [Candidatus Dormibacteraeota bacterium]
MSQLSDAMGGKLGEGIPMSDDQGQEAPLVDPSRLAAAPISWGVSEVPGWGHQMLADRVLREMRELGFGATEAGPPGWMPDTVGLPVVAGYVAANQMEPVDRQAAWLAARGARLLSLGAADAREGYGAQLRPTSETWEAIRRLEEVCARRGLTAAVHPHFGSQIETSAHVNELLERTRVGICLDTGHFLLGGIDPTLVPPERVVLVHLKDVDLALAAAVRDRRIGYHEAVRAGLYRPLGEGQAEIAKVVAWLEASGYGGWYVVEQDCVLCEEPPVGEGPVEDNRRSLEYLSGRRAT